MLNMVVESEFALYCIILNLIIFKEMNRKFFHSLNKVTYTFFIYNTIILNKKKNQISLSFSRF